MMLCVPQQKVFEMALAMPFTDALLNEEDWNNMNKGYSNIRESTDPHSAAGITPILYLSCQVMYFPGLDRHAFSCQLRHSFLCLLPQGLARTQERIQVCIFRAGF